MGSIGDSEIYVDFFPNKNCYKTIQAVKICCNWVTFNNLPFLLKVVCGKSLPVRIHQLFWFLFHTTPVWKVCVWVCWMKKLLPHFAHHNSWCLFHYQNRNNRNPDDQSEKSTKLSSQRKRAVPKKELDLYFKVLRSFWAFCTVLVFYHYCVNHYLSDFQLRLLQTLSDYFRCGQGEGTKNLGSTREQKITNTEHYCETLIKVGHFLHHPY